MASSTSQATQTDPIVDDATLDRYSLEAFVLTNAKMMAENEMVQFLDKMAKTSEMSDREKVATVEIVTKWIITINTIYTKYEDKIDVFEPEEVPALDTAEVIARDAAGASLDPPPTRPVTVARGFRMEKADVKEIMSILALFRAMLNRIRIVLDREVAYHEQERRYVMDQIRLWGPEAASALAFEVVNGEYRIKEEYRDRIRRDGAAAVLEDIYKRTMEDARAGPSAGPSPSAFVFVKYSKPRPVRWGLSFKARALHARLSIMKALGRL